jgi:dienelactone hydrolase
MSGARGGPGTASPDPMRDIDPVEPPDGAAWPFRVHRTGAPDDPPVIVMHELYGLTPTFAEFCRQLAAGGFCVWMPQLVGAAPSVTAVDKARALGAICVSREMDVLRSGRTSPVVTHLRALAGHVARESGRPAVGVVGMCLSGGFAIAMAADPAVVAAVAAQPTLPLRPVCGRALGLSADDAGTVRDRLDRAEVEILYTRFARDPLSPRSRLDSTVARLGQRGLSVDEVGGPGFRRWDHSVLTVAPEIYGTEGPQGARLAETAARVTGFLRRRLTQPSGQGSDDPRTAPPQ